MFETITITSGQTVPVPFRLLSPGDRAKGLSGATLKLALYKRDHWDTGELWPFDDSRAAVTLTDAANGECEWTPPSGDDAPDPGKYNAQLKVAWFNGTIEYVPKDGKSWDWDIYPTVIDKGEIDVDDD